MPDKFYYLALKKHNGLWYIHGLWPNFGDGTYPTFCKLITFHNILNKKLLNEMEHYWYSPDKTPDTHLWKHEYTKHGSCMFTDFTEKEYFTKTVELFLQMVQRGGIKQIKSNLQEYKFAFDTDFNLIIHQFSHI